MLDDAKNRLDGGLAFGIQRLAFGGAQAVFHPRDWIRGIRGFTGVSKALFQGGMMPSTTRGEQGDDAGLFTGLDVGLTEIAIVRQRMVDLTEFLRSLAKIVQRRLQFLFIVRVRAEVVFHDQATAMLHSRLGVVSLLKTTAAHRHDL